MRNSPDPHLHRQREREFVQHVEKLLEDDRLRIDTTQGRRPVTSLIREVKKNDRAVELKRLMAEMNLPDRELQNRMPVGESIELAVSRKKWFLFRSPVGRLKVACVSPTRSLLKSEASAPMSGAEVRGVLTEIPLSLKGIPSTIVLMSTSGFTLEAHELAERGADRTLILVEPNDAGGWNVWGPSEMRALTDLFDPEADQVKRQRVRSIIEESRAELLSGGIAADRIAARTELPLQVTEAEVKSYARETPGLTARRLDGRLILFRESAAPSAGASGGSEMPFIDKVRSLFSMRGENEKKIAFLSERRAALSQQRDRAYEDMTALEGKETELREQFKSSSSAIAKRRVTSQLLQLRRDIERRSQFLQVLNQQINVVSTHLHNLELVRQGQGGKLPDSEELTQDAVAAEEMLAQLEADNELAGSVGEMAHAGMSAEEQALFEELERESGESTTKIDLAHAEEPEIPQRASPNSVDGREPPSTPVAPPRRQEPEAG